MRFGIVSGDPLMVEALAGAVNRMTHHGVAWVASTDVELAHRCRAGMPDVVLMDVRHAGLDGVKATGAVMAAAPCPIIVVTVDEPFDPTPAFDAITRGALDVVAIPYYGTAADIGALLLAKISTLSRFMGASREPLVPCGKPDRSSGVPSQRLIAIGASAGGPAAVATILAGFGGRAPAAIVVVQHIDERFTVGMAEWLGARTGLPVRVATEGDRIVTGSVLIAGASGHLVLKGPDRLGYIKRREGDLYDSSIDVCFQSIGRTWPAVAVGVLLTGMGKDGARGLKDLRERGHHTIVQDKATSAVYGMPKAAMALDAAVESLAVDRIATRLVEILAAAVCNGSSSHR